MLTIALLCTAVLAAAACSSGDDDAAPTTAAPASTAAPSTVPDPRESEVAELMTERLATEFADPAMADAVMANLDPTILARFEQVTEPAEVAEVSVLAYLVEPSDEPVDALAVYAFGNRVAPDGSVTPGPTNEALADAVAAYVATNPVPVYAQWEVAELLIERGVPGVVSIEAVAGADGQVQYLSTTGVAQQIAQRAAADGVDLDTVGVVAHSDHLMRAIMATEAAAAANGGTVEAVAVEGIELPTTYDPESGQEWTRDRATYLTVDLSGRLATL